MEAVQHSRLLESHNAQLQTSLFDIAQMVVDDADRDDHEGSTVNANGSLITSSSSVLTRSASKPIIRPGV